MEKQDYISFVWFSIAFAVMIVGRFFFQPPWDGVVGVGGMFLMIGMLFVAFKSRTEKRFGRQSLILQVRRGRPQRVLTIAYRA